MPWGGVERTFFGAHATLTLDYKPDTLFQLVAWEPLDDNAFEVA